MRKLLREVLSRPAAPVSHRVTCTARPHVQGRPRRKAQGHGLSTTSESRLRDLRVSTSVRLPWGLLRTSLPHPAAWRSTAGASLRPPRCALRPLQFLASPGCGVRSLRVPGPSRGVGKVRAWPSRVCRGRRAGAGGTPRPCPRGRRTQRPAWEACGFEMRWDETDIRDACCRVAVLAHFMEYLFCQKGRRCCHSGVLSSSDETSHFSKKTSKAICCQ